MATNCTEGGGCVAWPAFCGYGDTESRTATTRTGPNVVDNQFELRIDDKQAFDGSSITAHKPHTQPIGVSTLDTELPENTDSRDEYQAYQDEYQVEVAQPEGAGPRLSQRIQPEDDAMQGKGWHWVAPMDEDATLDRVPWCFYCICGGCGCTRLPTTFSSLTKCCICVHKLEGKEMFNVNGCCSCLHSCCCSTCLCQLPPRGGSSRCVCCNVHACGQFSMKKWESIGRSGGGGAENAQQVYDFVLFEQFVPCYACCCGLGCLAGCMDFYSGFAKCCSLQWKMEFGLPWGEDGCCKVHHACWCCHCQLRMPPKHANNPIIGCCGWRLKTVKHHSSKAPTKAGAPSQQTMRGSTSSCD